MYLLRILVLNGLYHNRRLNANYVKSSDNVLADALSRGLIKKFRKLAPETINPLPDAIHLDLWPLSKLWQH